MTGTLHALDSKIIVKTVEPFTFEIVNYPLHPLETGHLALNGVNGVPVEFQVIELEGIKFATLNERSAQVYYKVGS